MDIDEFGQAELGLEMSYVVEVRRPADRSSLTRDDFERLVESDSSLTLTDERLIVWNGPENLDPLNVNVESDRLWTDSIGGRAQTNYLEKLREIARFLDAKVFGEEGEDLTEEFPSDPDHPRHGVSAFVGLVLFIVTIPVLALLFVVRLPWMIWKTSRALK